MKKLAIITIAIMSLMAIIFPIIDAEACRGHHASLVHSTTWGHNGTEHTTSHQIRDTNVVAVVRVYDIGHSVVVGTNGRTAFARVAARSNASHSHGCGISIAGPC